ncbi:MAG: flagellar biosynthesis protein FliQ [Actinomycetota bacterium]|nr:flagellar biosynthesis protein FliQ [Actinomycetota bacterium]
MLDAYVIDILRDALWVGLMVSGPILGVSIAVGTIISLLQALTQVQEMTLTFVPKLVAIAAVILILGGWMLNQLVEFTQRLYESVPGAI